MHQWTGNCFLFCLVAHCGPSAAQPGRQTRSRHFGFRFPAAALPAAQQTASSPAPADVTCKAMPGGTGRRLCIRAGKALSGIGEFKMAHSKVCCFHFSLAPQRDGAHCKRSTGPWRSERLRTTSGWCTNVRRPCPSKLTMRSELPELPTPRSEPQLPPSR